MAITRSPQISDATEAAFMAVLKGLSGLSGQESYDALVNALARLLMVHSDDETNARLRAGEAGDDIEQVIRLMLIRLTPTRTCASIIWLSGQSRPAPMEG